MPNWTGYEEISGQYFASIKNRKVAKELGFDITLEYIWSIFILQNRKCALTGLDLFFRVGSRRKPITQTQTASLDRIDSSKGYVRGNVWWVHNDLNSLKLDRKLDDLYIMLETVVKHHETTRT